MYKTIDAWLVGSWNWIQCSLILKAYII